MGRMIPLLAVLTALVSGQTPNKEELSSAAGRVLSAATGEPIGKVSLLLMRTDSSPSTYDWTRSYAASTDSGGRFEIRNIDRGKYRLRASRNGFVTIEYGTRGSRGRGGTVLDLESPRELNSLDIRLTPHVVISGRILDADGEPLQGTQIQLLRSQYVNGRKQLSRASTAVSNDLGEYRWAALTPGSYYLYAEHMEGQPPTSTIAEDYVPVYHPGVPNAASAVPLDLPAGAQMRVPDLMLRKAKTTVVKGRVVVELNGARGTPEVTLTREIGHDTSTVKGAFRMNPGRVNEAGEFEVRGVTPGSYTAQATIGKGGRSYAGWVSLDVAGISVEGVVITIGNGLSLTGRVRIDGDTAGDLTGAYLLLQYGGPAVMPETFRKYRIAEDFTFNIDDLDSRRFGILVAGLPDGFYMKSVRAGSVDVTYSGIDLKSGAPGPVEVLVSSKAGLVSGLVKNPKTGEPAEGATVVLVPRGEQRQSIVALYQQAAVDQYGRFLFRSVAPGEYKAYAWEDVESTAWMDPHFMKPLDDKGEAFTVEEGTQMSVQLNVIAADLTPGLP